MLKNRGLIHLLRVLIIVLIIGSVLCTVSGWFYVTKFKKDETKQTI